MPMRQLRSCDFCGEDASGIYEVLPPELSPTEDEQRRVVLCDDCLQTLETVVSPLLARLGFDAAESGDTAVEERGESPEPVSPSEMSNQDEDDIARRPIGTSAKDTTNVTPMATDVDGDTGRTADGGTEDEAAHGKTAAVDDEGNVGETSDEETFGDRPAEDYEVDEEAAVEETSEETETAAAGTGASAGENVEETSDEESFGDRPAEDYEVDDADRRQSVDSDPAEDYEVEDDVESTPASEVDDAEAIEAEPEKFRKVMRLLNNRDLPVQRDEFADVASGAYELDRSEVDAIIDYAIRRDVLEEENGRLGKA